MCGDDSKAPRADWIPLLLRVSLSCPAVTFDLRPALTFDLCPASQRRSFSLVSGSLRASRPPPTSAAKESRMGTTLVMPTKEAKIELPKMAASLHRALSIPNAVVLYRRDGGNKRDRMLYIFQRAYRSLKQLVY